MWLGTYPLLMQNDICLLTRYILKCSFVCFQNYKNLFFIFNNIPHEICRETSPSKVSTHKKAVLNVKRGHIF